MGDSGEEEDCPLFTYNYNSASCALENPLPAEIAYENVTGPIQGLPNGIQIQSGPEPASPPAGSKSGGASPRAAPPKNQEQNSAPAPTTIVKIPTVPVSAPSEPSSTQGAAAPPANQGSDSGGDGNANRYLQQDYSESPIIPPPKPPAETPLSPPSPIPAPPAPAPTPKPDIDIANAPPVALQAGKAVSTTYWTAGREVHEVVVILEEVTITADGGKVTQTEGAPGAEVTQQQQHYKRQHQHHQQKHQHHAGRGIGGRKMMI